jgi:hypothetical protein
MALSMENIENPIWNFGESKRANIWRIWEDVGMVGGLVPGTALEMKRLFRGGFTRPCDEGAELLRSFAIARPADFEFLDASDIRDRASWAFEGIPEWDAFAEHMATCRLCRAR